jgi:hypothetical protein
MGFDIGGYVFNSSMASNQVANQIITKDLVLYLDAGNINSYPGSGTTWTDLSGNGYNGTLVNGPTYNSANNGYLIFNGSNQNVTIPNASIPTGNLLSFCVWNYGITTQQSSVVESRDVNGTRTLNIHLPWSDGTVYFDCGGDRLSKAASNANYQGWHYWCFTKNVSTGQMKIFLDGVAWANSTGNVGSINATTAARLCSYAINTTYHNAYIGNVKIYNRALSTAEILQNYNIQKSRFGL